MANEPIETLEEMSCNPDVYSAEAVYLAAKHLKNLFLSFANMPKH